MTELPIVVNMTVDTSRTDYDLTAESNLEEIELLNDTVIETVGSGLTDEIKQALLACFRNVVWINDQGQQYYNDLYNALYPPVSLVSISAVYTQTSEVYSTDTLDSLRDDLVVTAHYEDNTDVVITNYTLSGTLTVGTSTITVTYGNKTTTFDVDVSVSNYTITNTLTHVTNSNSATGITDGSSYNATLTADTNYRIDTVTITMGDIDITSTAYTSETGVINIASATGNIVIVATGTETRRLLYNWDFKTSLIDTVSNLQMDLISSNSGTLPTRDETGLHFNAAAQVAQCAMNTGTANGYSYEFDVASAEFAGDAGKHKRLLFLGNNDGILIYRNSGQVQMYRNSWMTFTAESGQTIPTTTNQLSGKTVKIYLGTDRNAYLYIDGVLIGKRSGWVRANYAENRLAIGGAPTGDGSAGNQIYNMTITGLRVYNEEI